MNKQVKLICPSCKETFSHPSEQYEESGTWPTNCPNCQDTTAFPMVAGEGAAQYAFDVQPETQLALF